MNTFIKYVSRILFFGIILMWVALYQFSSPDVLIDYVGVENGYLLQFLFAFISGLSIFGLAPYHLMLVTLVIGGLNPFLLAIAATLGLGLGDSTSYFLGYQGRAILPPKAEPVVKKISEFLVRHERTFPLYIFLYGALIPFSNDFVGVTAGLLRYPFLRLMIPLSLGTLVFNLSVALLGISAYDLLHSFLSP